MMLTLRLLALVALIIVGNVCEYYKTTNINQRKKNQ